MFWFPILLYPISSLPQSKNNYEKTKKKIKKLKFGGIILSSGRMFSPHSLSIMGTLLKRTSFRAGPCLSLLLLADSQ